MASNRVPPAGATSATTSSAGIVQLTDSTSSTSTTTAATPNAVKSAYDLANGAIAKTLTTTTGDIIYASGANTPARLGIGSTNQVLTVSGGIPSWATPSSPAFDGVRVTKTNSQVFATGTHTTITWNSQKYITNNTYHNTSTNNTRITIPSTGYYRINVGITLPSTGDTMVLGINKNAGEELIQRNYSDGHNYSGAGATLDGIHYFSANDFIQITCWHNFGSNRTMFDGNEATYLEVIRLGA